MSVNSNGYIHLGGNIRNIYILLLVTFGLGQDYSLSFDGVDDWVMLNNSIAFGQNSFSVSIDCYLSSFGWNQSEPYSYIVGTPLTGNTSDHGFKIQTNSQAYNGGFSTLISDQTTSYGNFISYDNLTETNVLLDKWYNLTMVVDRDLGKFSFYVDGILIESQSIDPNFGDVDLGVPISIGVQSQNYTSLFDGYTDNLHIWGYALNETEVNLLIQNKPNGNEQGLIGYWDFNTGQGDILYDHSGNGNHGTIEGAQWAGCTDPLASNYLPDAEVDDGSCTYPDNGDYSLSFDGEDDWVDIVPNPNFKFHNDFSISLQAKVVRDNHSESLLYFRNNYLDNSPIIFIRHSEDNSGEYLDAVVVRGTNDYVAVRGDFIPIDEWFTITLSIQRDDVSTLVVYINDNQVGIDISNTSLGDLYFDDTSSENSGINFGRAPQLIAYNHDYLEGRIANCRIYNEAFSLNNQQSEDNLIAHYKFNVGDDTTLYDHSGNGNHGTINGAAWVTNGTKHVAEDGSDETGNGSADSPFSSIQYAIDMASDGDNVLVSAGTYLENINFKGKNIALIGEDRETIIDGGQMGSVVIFESGEDSTAVLEGFTLQNGEADKGGGIHCQNSSPTITNCNIVDNEATATDASIGSPQGGGGIYCNQSSPMITNCTINENDSNYGGGGIYCINNSSPTIANCIINENSSVVHGGGIDVYNSSFPIISDCMITNNDSQYGGGLWTLSSPTITNCTITGNTASGDGGGIESYSDSSSVIIKNSIISYNNANGNGGGINIKSNASPTIINSIILGNTVVGQGGGIFGSFNSLSQSLIFDNSATHGGAIYVNSGIPNISYSTIVNNFSTYGGGIYCDGSPTIVNSILWNNNNEQITISDSGGLEISYSDVDGGIYNGIGGSNENAAVWLDGNIDTDPLFCGTENGDFTVRSDSPVLGTGQDGVDMGAFGVGCEPIYGCTDSLAINDTYDPLANANDGSCEYPDNGDYSLSFDGVDDYVIIEDSDILSPNDITVELWINQPELIDVGNRYIYKSDAENGIEYMIGEGVEGGIGAGVDNPDGYQDNHINTNVHPISNEWNHLAFTYNTTINVITIFLNGELIGQTSLLNNIDIPNTDGRMVIGSYASDIGGNPDQNSYNFTGFLDEVRISDVVRYTSNFSMPDNDFTVDENTIALYKVNAGEDSTLYDHSGNGNHGTINGAAWVTNGTKHVAEDGSDETGNGSADSPFSSIQYAIDMASDGDSVLVSAGTYLENINFKGKNIALIGEDRETTIIDGGGNGIVVTFHNGESSDAKVKNFTIQNGLANNPWPYECGGGILVVSSGPTLEYLIVKNNQAVGGGGGGIYLCNSSSLVKNINVLNNVATEFTGGIYISSGNNPVIKNSIIRNNSGYQMYVQSQGTSPIIQYNNIENFSVEQFDNAAELSIMEFNIDSDPQFTDSENGDFTLQPTSPCIDAGDPDLDGDGTDFDGPDDILGNEDDDIDDQDLDGTRTDMGAYPFFHIWGCTDESACNYDVDANTEDGSCNMPDCAGECNGEESGNNDLDDCDTCDDDSSNDCIDYCLDLHEGANLISFYALPDDISITHVMSSVEGNATSLIGEGVAANYNGTEWMGSLNTISSLSGYWVIVSEAGSLCIEDGIPTDPDIQYSLHSGANLISFPIEGSVEISSSLPDDIEGYVSSIIGEGVAANNQPPWQGSLSALSGGNGYWMITTDDISFSFDVSTMSRIKFDDEVGLTAPDNKEIHQSTKQAFYFIEDIENIEIGDWILAYNGDKVIGTRQWQGTIIDLPAMGDDGSDYTKGYIESGKVPSFKILRDDELINLEGDIPSWENNQLFMVSSLTEAIPLPESFSLDRAYPNPFNPTTTLSFAIPVDSEVILSVYNLQGREVVSLINDNMDAGYHSVIWNADSYSSGVYFVKMVAGEFVNTQKLMLIK